MPLGAVVEVEGKSAVFVPGEGERTFVIRPVKLGREALGRQVVAEGLKPGDRVVVAGAFLHQERADPPERDRRGLRRARSGWPAWPPPRGRGSG